MHSINESPVMEMIFVVEKGTLTDITQITERNTFSVEVSWQTGATKKSVFSVIGGRYEVGPINSLYQEREVWR